MKNSFQTMKRFIESEDGPTAVEYAVVAALVIIGAIVGITALGTGLRNWFQETGTYVDGLATGA